MLNRPILLLLLTLLLCGCSDKDLTGSEVTNENMISLTGKVIDQHGKGVAGVEARLATYGFVDTTDLAGTYAIEISNDSLTSLGINVVGTQDTLIVTQATNLLSSFDISTFVDTLPDTYLIQRNVWGKVITSLSGFTRIEAVIKKKGELPENSKSIELWLNSSTNTYSGFIYMLQDIAPTIYEIFVQIYDVNGRPTGRSETVEFPQNAGDIQMPDFNASNTLPLVSISSVETAKVVTPVTFTAIVSDLYESSVASIVWEFSDGTTVNGNTASYTFYKDQVETVKVTVIDNDGNIAQATQNISITNPDAIVTGLVDTAVTINDTLHFSISTQDEHGIAKILWDFGEGDESRPQFDSTINSATSMVSHIYPNAQSVPLETEVPYLVTVSIVDIWGDTTTIVKTVTVSNKVPRLNIVNQTKAASLGDMYTINFNVVDDSKEVSVSYKDFASENFIQIEDTNLTFSVPNVCNSEYPFIIKLIDSDNNEVYDTIPVTLGVFNYGFDFHKIGGICTNAENEIFVLNTTSNSQVELLRFNHKGQFIKKVLIQGNSGESIISTQDNALAIIGHTNYYQSYLTKISRDGEILWRKEFAKNEYKPLRFYDITESHQGDFIITGGNGSRRFYEGDDAPELHWFNVQVTLLKTDPNGETIWFKSFPDTLDLSKKDIGFAVCELENGNIMVAGSRHNDVLVMATNSAGDSLWTSTYFTNLQNKVNIASSIFQHSNGNIIVTGLHNALRHGDDGDAFILSTTPNGQLNWVKAYPSLGGDNSIAFETYDRGIMFTNERYLKGNLYLGTKTVLSPQIIKFDSNGDTLWRNEMLGYGLAQTGDGGIVTIESDVRNVAGYSDRIIKLDKNGGYVKIQ